MGIVVKQSIKGTLMSYMGVAVGLVTTFFVMTKYLTPEEIGLTRVLADAAILLSGLAQMGTATSAIRYYPFFKDEKKRDHGFFGWTLIVPLVGFVVFTALFFAFKPSLVAYFSKNSALFVDYMYFVIPMAFFMVYLVVFETNSNLLMRIVFPRFIREVGIRTFTLIDYILYIVGVINLDGMVIGLCVAYVLATLLNIIYLLSLKKISFKIEPGYVDKKIRNDFLKYTLIMIISSVITTIVPMLNSFMISAKMGLMFTGIYKIANDMAALVEMPYRALGSISKPAVSQAMKDNNMPAVQSLTKDVALHQLMAGLMVFFIIWINIDLFFSVLPNGDVYDVGKWVFFILVIAKLINTSLNIGVTVMSYSKYYHIQLFFTATLTTIAIIFNNVFIPKFGMVGSALASLCSFSIYYILILSVIAWKSNVHPFSWNMLKLVVIMVFLFAINWLSMRYVSTSLIALFGDGIIAKFIEALFRTLIFVMAGLSLIYHFNVSKQVNELIDKALKIMWRK
ncbi:MAG: oligosaccharide flippase family protein [Bacteroidia bacterium]|nr:oligosaccharide flippase family protein [Bacteroidia bacterium]